MIKGDDLPEGWVLAKLEDLCTPPQYGWTTSADKDRAGLKLLRTTDISGGRIDWSSVPGCAQEPDDLQRYLLAPGDILISRAGSVGVSYLVNKCPRAIFASYLIRFRPKPPLESKLIALFLKSPQYWAAIIDETAGIAIPNVNASKLKRIEVPLPPLAEQKRIVAKVGELFARVNATKERLAKVAVILKRFRQAVLSAACSGRLTAHWRKNNPDVESILDFLIRIKNEHKIKGLGHILGAKAEKNSFPNSWNHIELAILVESLMNGIYKPDTFYSNEGVISLRMYNIQNGKIIWNNLKRMHLTSKEIDKYSLKPGDILINRVNSRELVGKAAIIEEIKEPVVFESKNIRLRLIEKNTLPRFINYCFMTRMVKDVFEGDAKQTVGMATISQPQISSLKFAIPPLLEQEEIIRRVETLFRIADSIEKQVTYATVRAEKLTQAILAKAFRGELVLTEAELARREGRVYEPASVLLARIMGERADKGTNLKPNGRSAFKNRPKKVLTKSIN